MTLKRQPVIASARLRILIKGHVGTVNKRHLPMKSTQIDALVAIAKKLERDGAIECAEGLYRKAVSTSELFYGVSSPLTGLAVLELMSFCQNHNNDTEAANLWKRLRVIVLECEG